MPLHPRTPGLTAFAAAAALLTGAAPAAKPFVAPGLAAQHWRILGIDDEAATLFTDAGLSHSGGMGRGWFTKDYFEPKDYPGTNLSGVKYIQVLYQANCRSGTFQELQIDIYGEDKRLLAEGPVPGDKPERPEPGSYGADEVRLICGLPVKEASADAGALDIEGMWPRYMTWLHEKQMNGGR